jgi:uncharacterized protein (TIGR00299 family) protein
MSTIAYFDCPAGAAGDMILAAFLDLGLPLDHLQSELAKLAVDHYHLETKTTEKHHLAATQFIVHVDHQHHHRTLADIRNMIQQSKLSDGVKQKAIAVFEKLGAVEGRIHGVPADQVHFHEVGAVDSIVDIVGACIAWEYFNLDQVWCSPLPLGSGFIKAAHGRLPLPAPATLALLEGVPTYGSGVEAEMVTPTGAAVLTTLVKNFGPRPAMTVTKTGYGAGSRNLEDRPNIIRLTLGETQAGLIIETLVLGETNIDDMNPEIYPYVLQKLLDAGAMDAWLTPIQMKKGRPAVTLSFLCPPDVGDALIQIVLAETTTLGVRTQEIRRGCLPRTQDTVDTEFGPVSVKVVEKNGRMEKIPEFESCRQIAEKTGRPLKDIYLAAWKTDDGTA